MKEFFKEHWKDILLCVFFLVILALIMSTTCTKQKLDDAETNIKALTDTVAVYQMKNGELMYEKQGFILEKKQLEEYLDISKNEIKDLEKKLGSAIATISKMNGVVKIDTIRMVDSVYIDNDSVININFWYKDDWLAMNGVTTYKKPIASTQLNNLGMDVPLKIGTTEDNQWFVTTENPYVSFPSIEGANLNNQKDKRWSFGVQFGIGVLGGYGASGAKDGIVRSGWIVGAGAYAGIGFTYKLFEF